MYNIMSKLIYLRVVYYNICVEFRATLLECTKNEREAYRNTFEQV